MLANQGRHAAFVAAALVLAIAAAAARADTVAAPGPRDTSTCPETDRWDIDPAVTAPSEAARPEMDVSNAGAVPGAMLLDLADDPTMAAALTTPLMRFLMAADVAPGGQVRMELASLIDPAAGTSLALLGRDLTIDILADLPAALADEQFGRPPAPRVPAAGGTRPRPAGPARTRPNAARAGEADPAGPAAAPRSFLAAAAGPATMAVLLAALGTAVWRLRKR